MGDWDCSIAQGDLHERADPNALAKAQVLWPARACCARGQRCRGRRDDNADNDYSADEAVLAWKADEFDADQLGGLSRLLAQLEPGNGKDAVTALLGGLTQKEIAAQLHVSEPTISRALTSAYAKLRSLVDVPATAWKRRPQAQTRIRAASTRPNPKTRQRATLARCPASTLFNKNRRDTECSTKEYIRE